MQEDPTMARAREMFEQAARNPVRRDGVPTVDELDLTSFKLSLYSSDVADLREIVKTIETPDGGLDEHRASLAHLIAHLTSDIDMLGSLLGQLETIRTEAMYAYDDVTP